MRPRARPLLVLGFVLLMGALLYVHDPPSPIASRALKEAASRLKAYYREHPAQDTWKITSITTKAGVVWVDIVIPEADAVEFPERPDPAVGQAIGSACPPMTDVVWRLLSAGQEIEVRGAISRGRALVAVNCRVFNN